MNRSQVLGSMQAGRCADQCTAKPAVWVLAILLMLGVGVTACGSVATPRDTATATIQPTATARLTPPRVVSATPALPTDWPTATTVPPTPALTATATSAPPTATPIPPTATPAISSGPFHTTTPPAPDLAGAGQSIPEMFEPQIQSFLDAGGDAETLQAHLAGLTLTDSEGTAWQSRSQVFAADVTGDGQAEVVLDLSFFVEGQFADGAIFVYRCQAGRCTGGAIERIGGQVFSADDPDPGIRAIQDLNGNGRAEIVFSYVAVIGTHANFTRHFRILEWDGERFTDLIQSDDPALAVAEVQNGDGKILDTDKDGFLELVLTHGVGRGPDVHALDRPRTDIWAWDGEAFVLAGSQAASPPVFRIHAVWDGDEATLREDDSAALASYRQAIGDATLLGWSQGRQLSDAAYAGSATPTPDPDEAGRLSAYSQFRILLLRAQTSMGDLDYARLLYDWTLK